MQRLFRLLGAADVVVRSKALLVSELQQIVMSLNITDPDDIVFECEIITAFFLCLRTEDHVGGRMR